MKPLKPFIKSFFSEWFLSPDRDNDAETGAKKLEEEGVQVGDLISFADEKEKKKELEHVEDEVTAWTTRGGAGGQYHGGLFVLSSMCNFFRLLC